MAMNPAILAAISMAMACSPTQVNMNEERAGNSSTKELVGCLDSGEAALGMSAAIYECYRQSYERVDGVLNEIYGRKISNLSGERRRHLRASELNWIKYRDKTCEITSNERLKSQVITEDERILEISCLISETEKRIKVIERY